MGQGFMTCTGGFDKELLMQVGLYPGYPELGIFSQTRVGPVSIRLNLLNP